MPALPGPLEFFFWIKKIGFWKAGLRKKVWAHACGPVHFQRGGRGTPVVLIHGLGGSVLQDFPNLTALLAKNHDVCAIDLPGFGLSEHVDFEQSIENHVRVLHDFLEWQNIKNPVMIGNSMGGWVTLSHCLAHPGFARKIVLLAPAGIDFDPPPPEIFMPESPADMDRLLAYLIHRPPRINDWFRKDWFRVMAAHRPAIQAMIGRMLTREEVLRQEQIARIREPALIIFGREDRIIPCSTGQHLYEWLPNAKLIVHEDCGHLVQADQFAAVTTQIVQFIDGSPEKE